MSAAAENARLRKLTAAMTETALVVTVGGTWRLTDGLPARDAVNALLSEQAPTELRLSDDRLDEWDSSLVTTLTEIIRTARALYPQIRVNPKNLPDHLQQLLGLAFAVEVPDDARREQTPDSLSRQVGIYTLNVVRFVGELTTFTGKLVLSVKRMIMGQATYKPANIWLEMQQAGAEALPIVGLISFLIGMIFAFVGVMQLTNFGAGIYTANLVAVAMVREMGPIMTAIIMAGRTGASYAAQLGTMRVNEEIDALTTLGINPIDYLVMPRFIALIVMLPVLTIYADVLGIFGGAFVSLLMLDITTVQYAVQTESALNFNTLFGGLFKALVYGGLVALAGTQQGINCGTSAQAVGEATTRAVVTGIVLIVVSASLLTVIYVNLGI